MCYAVFIASTTDLPLVPNPDPLLFGVEELAKEYQAIQTHFPLGWHIRYVGSSSGCSCDLRGDGSQPSREAFAKYLARLPQGAPVSIYTCWEGDFSEPSEELIDATIADLLADDQLISERRLITLIDH
jgi:hypothetical protein